MDSVVGFPAEGFTLVVATEAAKGGNEITIKSATRYIYTGMVVAAAGIPPNTVVKSVAAAASGEPRCERGDARATIQPGIDADAGGAH